MQNAILCCFILYENSSCFFCCIYKKQGIYDFPQKKWAASLKMYLVGALLSNEKILTKMGNKMNEGMLMPYKKAMKNAEKK